MLVDSACKIKELAREGAFEQIGKFVEPLPDEASLLAHDFLRPALVSGKQVKAG